MTRRPLQAVRLPLPAGHFRIRAGWLLAAAALSLAAAAGTAKAETITFAGTGASLGPMRILAAEFARVAPAHTVVVVPNLGTGGSMKALAAGAIDLAAIGRALKSEESALGLVGVEYGTTALVVVTSTRDAGTVKTFAELADLYAGHRVNWADGKPIRVLMRARSDVDILLQEAYSPELKQAIPVALARPGMVIAATDQDAADYLERTPGAIGVISLALVRSEKRNVTVLPLNGVIASPRTIADGSYPYVKDMFLVRKGAGTPGVASFFEFIASPRGRQILTDTGHWAGQAKDTR